MKNKKYFSLHAHFYQPPRENPWTGEIGLQDSAFPYDDWNHRIFMECYLPNLYGRIKNYRNEVLETVNNYEYFNFNFGPTLLNWLEKEYPFYYARLVETVKRTRQIKGHSNIIAQAYNHTILPLDDFGNKMLQITWGIRDFENRFGFTPEGLWLPEAAVNLDTIRLLIDRKIKYIVLAPYQIKNITDLSGRPALRRDSSPCIFYDRSDEGVKLKDRSIVIFPYDGELSRKAAFENITENSMLFSQAVSSLYKENSDTPQLFLLASDGETYGHHHKFADLTLSHAFKYELSKRGIETISLSEYLSLYPPSLECELEPGLDSDGTAWSCSHGLRRWKGGCPCGDEGKYNTIWRTPLRSAMQWLSAVAQDIYTEEGSKFFINPVKAAEEYVDILRGTSKDSKEDFFSRNLKPENADRARASRLLELRKYSMFIFTSCGWFFNDISRIETRQNLKYAARIAEIAEYFGFKGIGRVFSSILEMARSNFKELSDGKKIYEEDIVTSSLSAEMAAGYLALKTFYSGLRERQNARYSLSLSETSLSAEKLTAYCTMEDRETSIVKKYYVEADNSTQTPLKIYVKEAGGTETLAFEISSYPRDIQKELIGFAICRLRESNLASLEKLFFSYASLLEKNPKVMFYNFESILGELKILFSQIIKIKLKDFLINPSEEKLSSLSEFISYAEKIKITPQMEITPDLMALMPAFCRWLFSGSVNAEKASSLMPMFSRLGLYEFCFHIENFILGSREPSKAGV